MIDLVLFSKRFRLRQMYILLHVTDGLLLAKISMGLSDDESSCVRYIEGTLSLSLDQQSIHFTGETST